MKSLSAVYKSYMILLLKIRKKSLATTYKVNVIYFITNLHNVLYNVRFQKSIV